MIEKSSFNGDLLGRDDELKNLSMLIEGTTEPLTLAINAAWGAGKTTFVKELWKPYLAAEHGIESFYFSAWENDYSDEPLVSILGEFNSYLSSKYISDSKNIKKIQEAFITIGKLAIVESIKKATADIVDVSALIDSYSLTKDSVEEFRKQISTLLASIYGDQNDGKPFVIFIDELDRCRPLYAIEFLERIKHLFNIKRLIFVLSIDKAQLAESIKSQYGNIDVDNYLRRFIDLDYQLSLGNTEKFCRAKIAEFQLYDILQIKRIEQNGLIYSHYAELFAMHVKIFNTSLRSIEQILLRLNVIYKAAERERLSEHFIVVTYLAFVKNYNSDLYYSFINGNEKHTVKNLIEQHKIELVESRCKRRIFYFLDIITESAGLKDEEFENLTVEIEADANKKSEYPYTLLTGKSDRLGDYKFSDLINKAIKMIEFSDRFIVDE